MDEKYFENLSRTEEGFSEIKYESKGKKIFLIGDSICRGYRPFVRNNFKGTYDVLYPEENCRNSQYIITSLKGWVNAFEDTDDVELVSFNCGHWDIAHWNAEPESLTNIAEYEHNIRRIIRQLKRFFPKAMILFFTTSPINPNGKIEMQNPRNNDEIRIYNEASVKAAKSEGVFVEDLYAFMKEWDETHFTDYVHLTPEAAEQLGDHITKVILNLLKR